MTTLEVFFIPGKNDYAVPYIRDEKPIEYICDGKEGSITFDGYYYVENHPPPYPEDAHLEIWNRVRRYQESLPKKIMMFMKIRESKPYKIEDDGEFCTKEYYKTIKEEAYNIEIYKKVIHKCTNQTGESLDICFFPTNTQTIYFRVLETL